MPCGARLLLLPKSCRRAARDPNAPILLPLLTLALLAPSGALAQAAFDIPAKYPRAMQAYQALVPQPLRKVAWIYRFAGTSDDVEQVTVEGRSYLLGWVCQPHDCAENALVFLIARDGSRAVAALRSANHNRGETVTWGAPSHPELRALIGRLTRD